MSSQVPPDEIDTLRDAPFQVGPSLRLRDDSGSITLGPFERLYEALFSEAMQGGLISAAERRRLNQAATALGLDPTKVAALEAALLHAWESSAADTLSAPRPDTLAEHPGPAPSPPDDDEDPPTLARPRARPASPGPPQQLMVHELHARFEAASRRGDRDLAWRISDVLMRGNLATSSERELWAAYRRPGPARAATPMNGEAWAALAHPDEDPTTSAIFGVIAPAALLGRVSAMLRDGTLPKLDGRSLQDPANTTVIAVQALTWAAATLGLRAPPVYLAPGLDAGYDIVAMVPPATRVGARALSGCSTVELAFSAGRHLSWFREEHFICTLVPSVAYLEAIFYAALQLGEPDLEVPATIRERALDFSRAIVPCLEAPQIERLSQRVGQFLAAGGRTDLKRWVRAAEYTACRAGLLLCGELSVAAEQLAREPGSQRRIADLGAFWVSEEAGAVRRRLGVALT